MSRIKAVFLALNLAALAACSSQPAMQLSHVAVLHSGSVLVAVPKRSYFTLTSPYTVSGSTLNEGLGIVMGGAVGGAIMAATTPDQKDKAITSIVLMPYANQIRRMPPGQHFLDVARSAVSQAPWMGSEPDVTQYSGKGVPGFGAMNHKVQSGSTQAVVLLNCEVGFSFDLKVLYAVVQVEVYTKGNQHANLIDGGTLKAGTDMQDAGPALGAYGVEGIASGKLNDRAALGARANLWFEDDGKRYKAAAAEDMAKLRPMLINYLNGRRSAT
ncbi:MAG: hypothetical protein ACRETC_10875 [Gammaproteobacteria bacterium]